ncbi:Tropomodulin isoform 2 [Schistosoma japonicum]|uniref:Tropomodulin isoform 2 n=3 Tax=Schistosoma japonicum TaxID=6182 RepID=A0A4Z2D5D3_SCHJA|nr:Tropomodulin isoform 2 [Schistosoma japonicum]
MLCSRHTMNVSELQVRAWNVLLKESHKKCLNIAVMSNKLLFGKALNSYDDEDIDALLSKLTPEELEQLNDDFDPDNSLLPPSQRCRDQTTKTPTGPYDREKLLRYLIEKAKAEKDWEEAVPYEKRKRGKVYAPKQTISPNTQNDLAEMGFDVEFDEDVNKALENATEDELVDLAAVLGFTGMLNQVQFHASLEGRKLEMGGFSGVAKAERPKITPDEPPNTTDVEDSIKMLEANNKELTKLNLNNIKTISTEVVQRLCAALTKNTKLTELHMAATRLTNAMIEPFCDMLQKNTTLKVLNLESNFLTGVILVRLLESVAHEKSGITDLHLANQRQSVLGVQIEQNLTELILSNPRLVRLGLDLDTSDARVRTREHVKSNLDRVSRQVRRNKN